MPISRIENKINAKTAKVINRLSDYILKRSNNLIEPASLIIKYVNSIKSPKIRKRKVKA